ncbi:MAG: polysaccharide biosynthesis/export family protein [Alphaproteobacteria bacterium]|nr:polysaccharide biosynthesis/export family protein [Alphaproteobacteria bacterium]
MGRTISLLLLRASAIVCAGLLLFAVFAPARAGSYTNDDYGLAPLPPASQAAAASATTYNGTSGYTPAPNQYASGQYASGQYASGQPASLSAPANAGAGFTPAPGSANASAAPTYQQAPAYQQPPAYQQASGYTPAPGYQPASQAPVYQQPLPAPGYASPGYAPPNYATPPLQAPPYPSTAYVAPGAAGPGYGFNAQMGGSATPASDPGRAQMFAQAAPPPQTALRQSADATTPYGYNKGDGEDRTAVPQPGAGGYYQPTMFQTADNSPRTNPDYVLGTGDKIHLSVFDEADLSGDYTVDGSGYVRLPLIGQVRAAGYTPPQVEAEIGSALANGYLRSPRVSVEVVTYRPFYVVGAVGRPGQYAYVNHMTVMNAIAMAGGFLPSAVQSVVYVRHEGSPTEYRLDTDRPNPIRPGDVLRVDTTVFWDAMSLFSPLNGVASIAVAGIRP